MNVSINLDKINIDKVNIVSSTFGHLSALTIKVELNNGLRIGIPIINRKLAAHQLTFPSNIFGIFLLSDLTLGYHDNYIYAGATPTFVGPSRIDKTAPVMGVREAI